MARSSRAPATDKLPWMPFYATDWLLDERVRSLDWAQRGLYFDMLCWQWREGSLPNNIEQIRQMLGNQADPASIDAILQTFFTIVDDNRVVNRRLESVRADSVAVSRKLSEAGKRGRRKQLRGVGQARATPKPAPGQPRANNSHIHITTQRPKTSLGNWVVPLGDAWEARFRGTVPYKRIGHAIKPLRATYPDDEILTRWKRFLAQAKPGVSTPEGFAQTFGEWAPKRGLRNAYLTAKDLDALDS